VCAFWGLEREKEGLLAKSFGESLSQEDLLEREKERDRASERASEGENCLKSLRSF
jgi:hypothetical protein